MNTVLLKNPFWIFWKMKKVCRVSSIGSEKVLYLFQSISFGNWDMNALKFALWWMTINKKMKYILLIYSSDYRVYAWAESVRKTHILNVYFYYFTVLLIDFNSCNETTAFLNSSDHWIVYLIRALYNIYKYHIEWRTVLNWNDGFSPFRSSFRANANCHHYLVDFSRWINGSPIS